VRPASWRVDVGEKVRWVEMVVLRKVCFRRRAAGVSRSLREKELPRRERPPKEEGKEWKDLYLEKKER